MQHVTHPIYHSLGSRAAYMICEIINKTTMRHSGVILRKLLQPGQGSVADSPKDGFAFPFRQLVCISKTFSWPLHTPEQENTRAKK
jgi:hypothetical protein